jgi:NitT/TauT family transport system permease protein
MALTLFYPKRVRDLLKRPASLGPDLLFLLLIGGGLGLLILLGRRAITPYNEKVFIDLRFRALPKYTMLSLSRGFAAYFLSLIFTLIYGTIAAHNRIAEKFMIPALDVLQSIPVLSFMPGVVLAMVALFPTREMGLELACVITIFTAQVWNMTFSYYGSIRTIPQPLREVAVMHRLGVFKVFYLLELPAAMIGLVWNSMMSMAGGWFFLTVDEEFQLPGHDFRLPGIGSYMQEGLNQFDPHVGSTWLPILAAIVAMTIMIVLVDQLFWRPIVAWAERFKMEETAETDKPESWVLDLLVTSRIYHFFANLIARYRNRHATKDGGADIAAAGAAAPILLVSRPPSPASRMGAIGVTLLKWAVVLALVIGGVRGMIELIHLLTALPVNHSAAGEDWVHVLLALLASLARTTSAVVLGAIWALPAGILIGLSPKWSRRLQPIIQVAASFPAPMLFPLVTLALAATHLPFNIACVSLMLLGTQWYILFNVIAGAMAIPGELKEVCKIYKTTLAERWLRLYLPCVFPYLVTGMVTAAGGAWNATIVAEYVQINTTTYNAFGLGSIIAQAASNNFPLLAAATVTMAVSVVIINRLFWKRMYRTAENRFSLTV